MYIEETIYGGIDWHDSNTINTQLEINGDYDLKEEDAAGIIADRIVKLLGDKSGMSNGEFKDLILNSFKKECDTTIRLYFEGQDEEIVDEFGKTYYENELVLTPMEKHDDPTYIYGFSVNAAFGQVSHVYSYFGIKPQNPCYVVLENFLAPRKGVPSIERIYRDVFFDDKEAKDYLDKMELHSKDVNLLGSRKELLVRDYDKMKEGEWYKSNMEAISLMDEKGATPYDDAFSIFPDTHIKNLNQI